ncbi:MAG: HD-GYP domain-containing protein [Endomicrobia bacterium]|nr:HD-GYP domain-containing protein [Endomicrobiia bacterium]
MRLSDILKKIQQIPQKTTQEESVNNTKQQEDFEKKLKTQSFITLVDKIEFDKIYGSAIKRYKYSFNQLLKNSTSISINDILVSVRELIEAIKNNQDEMFLYSNYSTVDNYVYGHSVNVAIYSAIIGLAKKFEEQEVEKLVLCGMLHDIGMSKYLDIANKPDKLTELEFQEIKKHSEIVLSILKLFDITAGTREFLYKVISQVHERCDGSGYPQNLRCDEMELFSKIISIADVYEAMSHPRSYRDRILPHHAIIALVKQAQTQLDTQLVKLFVDKVSIFPVGSFVKLSTSEVAKVVGTNPSFPVRPKVKVILTSDDIVTTQSEILNLAEISSITIVEPVDETKLNISDKKLLLQLKAQRWWVKDSDL